jgi:hypothetical protein
MSAVRCWSHPRVYLWVKVRRGIKGGAEFYHKAVAESAVERWENEYWGKSGQYFGDAKPACQYLENRGNFPTPHLPVSPLSPFSPALSLSPQISPLCSPPYRLTGWRGIKQAWLIDRIMPVRG